MSQGVRDRWAVGLILAIWLWSVVPRLTQTITAPKYRVRLGQSAIADSGPTVVVELALTLTILAVAAMCVLRCYEPGMRLMLGGLVLLLAPWAYVVVRDVLAGDLPRKEALVYPMVVLGIWAVRPSVRVLGSLGWLTGAAAVLSVSLAVLLPGKGVFAATSGEILLQDKAILPWGTLVGFLTQGNNLGVFLALGLPFVALVNPRWVRWSFLVLTVFALLWTASRGSMAAVGVGALAALVILVMSERLRPHLGPVVGLTPLVGVVVVPLLTTDPLAFTNRGQLWLKGLEWWGEDVWWGLGSGFYAELAMTSQRISASAYHGHNEFVHVGVTGGLVLVVLIGALMAGLAVAAGRCGHRSVAGLTYVATLGATMLLERPLSFVDNLSIFPMVITPVALILVIGGTGVAEPRTPVPASARPPSGGGRAVADPLTAVQALHPAERGGKALLGSDARRRSVGEHREEQGKGAEDESH